MESQQASNPEKTKLEVTEQDERQQSQWRQSALYETLDEILSHPLEQFSLADFGTEEESGDKYHRYDERDYKFHRQESFPQPHQSWHRPHHRRRRKTSHSTDQDDPDVEEPLLSGSELPAAPDSSEGEGKKDVLDPLHGPATVDGTHFVTGQQKDHPDLTKSGSCGNGEKGENPEEKVHFFLGSMTSLDKQDGRTEVLRKGESTFHTPSHSGDEISSKQGPLHPRRSSLKPAKSRSVHSHEEAVSEDRLSMESSVPSEVVPARTRMNPDHICELEPLMSERAAAPVPDNRKLSESHREPKVTFELGDEIKEEDGKNETKAREEEGKKRHRNRDKHDHHRHHHHRRHYRRQGSDIEPSYMSWIVTEPDEAETLQTADLEDIASRRFENPRGIRRHKIQAKSSVSSFIHLSRKDGSGARASPFVKKLYDHQPHEIFVELDELVSGEGEELEWKETARWIKYEENIEEGADRWGKPHIASLSFHSLLSLRKCIEQGTVLLDLEEKDLPGIAYRIVENMVITDQIKSEQRGAVMRALLLRHRHVNERNFAPFGLRRNYSGYSNLYLAGHDKYKSSPKTISSNGSFTCQDIPVVKVAPISSFRSAASDTALPVDDEQSQKQGEIMFHSVSQEDIPKLDQSILRRIPEGAEATTVLVGALDFLEQPTIAFVRLAEGQIMPNLVEVSIPVRFVFVLLGPMHTSLDYHEIGRSISTLMSNRHFHETAYQAEDRKDLLCAVNEFLDDSIVLPPGDWERKSLLPFQEIKEKNQELKKRKKKEQKERDTVPEEKPPPYDPLRRSGRLFGGFLNDIKNRFPYYLSDIRDGLNAQCLASAIFIYFAALSGAITFGGLMGDKTDNLIGVSETLVVTAFTGLLYSLLSGQPLVIIGTTGPVLLFDEILFKFCKDHDIEFLPMRCWTGLWVAIIATLVVAFEGSSLVRFFTRFTQEIFTSLISLIFIFESFSKLYKVFVNHPLLTDYCTNDTAQASHFNSTGDRLKPTNIPGLANNSTDLLQPNGTITNIVNSIHPHDDKLPKNQPNTALLSTVMMIGTFLIAYYLRQFRNSKFLGRSVRRALGDFGVPIAIILMVIIDSNIRNSYTQKLSVPEGLSPSKPSYRGWFISPLGMEREIAVWQVFGAFVAALLIFILLFLEIQICELIINKKERKLKKGSGFHLDLMLISYMELACAILGGPWICAATVRSVSHVASLTVMSRTHAPGDMPHVIEVKEQRLTNLTVSLLIGLSVLMAPLLRKVPVAVLFGVFLYMGISSMSGIQLFERIQLLFMPVKHHPAVPYVRRVRTWKMNIYTLIQLLCLTILWVVKSTEAALAFPFVLLMMVPVRLQLKCCFTERELHALDGEEVDKEVEDEPDFYQQILP